MRSRTITSTDELRELPDGATLTSSTGRRLVWLRAYAHPHPDPNTGLWTLPRNPFTEWHVHEIDVEVPDAATTTAMTGDESWLSTLTDPHDTTEH